MVKHAGKYYKKATAQRNIRCKKALKPAEQKNRQELIDYYCEHNDTMPMPTLIDALSNQRDDGQYADIEKTIIDCFDNDIKMTSKSRQLNDESIPDNVISFIIPLDFHIPLNSPYNAVLIRTNGDIIDTIYCATIISKIVPVGTAFIKVSYIVASICNSSTASAINDIGGIKIRSIYEEAIGICNDIIASFQATSFRHNHYFHQITVLSSPSIVKFFVFNRKRNKVLLRDNLEIHRNIYSEIFNSFPNTEDELALFSASHTNKTFSGDRIFKLISKIQEAVNLRCLGFYNESIVASDNFVEMSLGYLICEIKIALGNDKPAVYDYFKQIKATSELWQELKKLLNYQSINRIKADVGFNDWSKYCRQRRDDLTHRFLTEDFSGVEALEAAYYSSRLVGRLCEIINERIKTPGYPLSDKLELLHRATFFAKTLYEGGE